MDHSLLESKIYEAITKDDLEKFIHNSNLFNNWKIHYSSLLDSYFINAAVKARSIKIVSYMIDNRVSVNLKDRENKTTIHLSLEFGLCEISSKILNLPFSEILFSKDNEMNNELHKWVIYHSSCEKCLKYLSKYKNFKTDYFTSKNNKNNNSLHQAVLEDDFTTVQLLTSGDYFNFDITELGENDSTLLHLSAIHKDNSIFELFFKLNKINLNLKNSKQETALTISLKNENFSISELLIDNGARVTSSDKRIAYEKSSKIYPKLKCIYDNQQQKYRNFSKDKESSHHSNAESKSIVICDEETQQQKNPRLSSVQKLKQSQDIKSMFKINDIDMNSNSSNNFLLDENKVSDKSNETYKIKQETEPKLPINPFQQTFNKSNNKESVSINNLFMPNKPVSNLQVSINSPFKSSLKSSSPINLISKSPLSKTPNTLNSNFFLNGCNGNNNNLNNFNGNNKLPYDSSSKRVSLYLNSNFNFDSLINFEYVKSFTSLDVNDIVIEEKIYSAEICTVYKGKYLALPVAIKIYSMSKLKEEDFKYFISEVNLLMSLRHPLIVTLIGTSFNKNDFYIVTEYLERRSLKNVLENKKINLTTLDKLKICYDISIAICYLHSRKPQVFHRDLKSSNCLVDNHNRVKLCDFGLSKIYEELKTRFDTTSNNNNFYQTNCTSTSFWMAPEFIRKNLFTDKADIYAFGILIWEVMMRDPIPYKDLSEMAFLCGDKDTLKKRPEIHKDMDNDIKNLMEVCWHADYTQRPDITWVVNKLESLIHIYKN